MANNKAFVRYANNKAVPGSLIVRKKAPSVGVWKEVNYDLCCDGGNVETCCSNETLVTLSFTPSVTTFNGISLYFYCNEELVSYGRFFSTTITLDNLVDVVAALNFTYGPDPDSPSLSPMIGNFLLDGDTITLTMTECKKQTFCPAGGELTFEITSAIPD
jgi:hypothetical protein